MLKERKVWKMNTPYSLLYTLFALIALPHLVQALPQVCGNNPPDPYEPDYCEEYEQPHLACSNETAWADVCGDNYKSIKMTDPVKSFILKTHNQYRNSVAKGATRLPPAARMLTLRWDENLASLAKLAAKLCRLRRPVEAFSTPTSFDPGYNAIYAKIPPTEHHDLKKILRAQMRMWYDQHIYLDVKSLASDISKPGQETGHFKQMMVGLNSRIGCAITRFSDKNWSYQLLVCLYGCKKKTEQKVFATGKFPGEYCHCGVSSPYKYLCRKSEPSLDCGLIVDHDMDNPNPVDNRGTMETLAKPTHRKSTMPPDFYNQFIRDLRM